jgi:hypothetical protein
MNVQSTKYLHKYEFEKIVCRTYSKNLNDYEKLGEAEVLELDQNQTKTKTKLHGLSLRANYTDQTTAACRRSNCQLVRIEGATWSA